MTATTDQLTPVRRLLGGAWTAFDGGEEITVTPGPVYRQGDPVPIRIRRRGRRYDLSDDGAGVDRAGRPPGWREATEAQVARDGFNVNRRGGVFVPAVEGRDIALLALRLAQSSRGCYLAVLELAADVG